MIEQILIAHDGSDSARKAFDFRRRTYSAPLSDPIKRGVKAEPRRK
jgi:hypothetical protein